MSFAAASLRRTPTQVPTPASFSLLARRWATSKSGGSTKNGRDSTSQRLGVKRFGSELVVPGNILVRQRGTKMVPLKDGSVGIGKDHTIFARIHGRVLFGRTPKGRVSVGVAPTL